MNIITYIKEAQAEMKKVTWLDTKSVIGLTIAVIVVSVLTAYFLGLFDIIFSKLLAALITK